MNRIEYRFPKLFHLTSASSLEDQIENFRSARQPVRNFGAAFKVISELISRKKKEILLPSVNPEEKYDGNTLQQTTGRNTNFQTIPNPKSMR